MVTQTTTHAGVQLPNLPPLYWGLSDNGSTSGLHPLGRSSILLASTNLGISYNGSTLGWHPCNRGSIPLVSTNFPAVIGHMLAACHTTVKKVPTFRGVREFN